MLSDQDSSSSNTGTSPESHVESPFSSPSQEVPYLANCFTVLTCNDSRCMESGQAGGPFLRITEQPTDHFRFRYKSEMNGTHGCLLGKSSSSSKLKTYPSVELVNYRDDAIVRCSLVQHDSEDDHPHQLVEDEKDKELSANVGPKTGFEVRFRGIGIIQTAKKDVARLLYRNYTKDFNPVYNTREIRTRCENEAKQINLNIVRLKFTAHNYQTGKEICQPVISEPIHNMKSAATNDLKITRMSRSTGHPSGGEDVYMLTEKVNKKNIDIRFFEKERGEVRWTAKGRFIPSDVHHQYAIVFRTPPYRNPEITSDVKVYVELVRPSDGRVSDPMEFTYIADEVVKQKMNKKRKFNSYSSIGSSSGGSIKSLSELPETVLMINAPNGNERAIMQDDDFHNFYMSIPQTPMVVQKAELAQAMYDDVVNQDPMHVLGPLLSQSNVPELRIDSGDLERITQKGSDEKICPDYINSNKELLKEYYDCFGKVDGLSFEDIYTSVRTIQADSGRKKDIQNLLSHSKNEPVALHTENKTQPTSSKASNSKESVGYHAIYNEKDGSEVKQLVKELCEIIRHKTQYKKQDVRDKLDRLFELRLSNGDTFLHMTLSCNILPSLQYIVKLIHNVKMNHLLNEQNHSRQTILHLAILNELPNLISFLISKGCDPTAEDLAGNNALHYAVKCPSCLEPLLQAIMANKIKYDINALNHEKQTALHLAVVYGSQSSVKLLLSHNASYSVRDINGRTPLHLAVYDSKLSVLETLLEFIQPSEIDTTDGQGNTALQIVCGIQQTSDSIRMADQLLQKGADPVKSEPHNDTAWNLAREKPGLRELMKNYLTSTVMLEDDIKSEEEFESADEGDTQESGLEAMSAYIHELSDILDRSGAWRELAARLDCDSLLNWYEKTPSPTTTLLKQVKVNREEVTSMSVAKLLRDMGQFEAANIILRYVDV